ncbi:MAG: hypothetical protein HC860_09430 [Alkalinema sp. RU_4_3]|nr:hypothetical protein [Alkalinema sp. RU_4_3]
MPQSSTESNSPFARLGRSICRRPAWILGIWTIAMILSLALTPGLEYSLKGAGMTYEGSVAVRRNKNFIGNWGCPLIQ